MAAPTLVEHIGAGEHVCLTFSDPDERLDLLAAFVADGLAAGQRVTCYTDAISPDTLAGELTERHFPAATAVERGQLRISDCATSWLGANTTAEQMHDALLAELRAAAEHGFPALRVTADMAWATRPHAAAHELLRFEQDFKDRLGDDRLTTICQYDRGSFDPVTLAFAAEVHPQAVAAQVYHEDALLRICRQYRPAGIRIAGELDYRGLEVLRQALAETLRLDQHPHVNIRQVSYLDAACAAALLQAGEQLSSGRTMHIRCGPLSATMLRLTGAVGVAQLRLTEAP